MHRAKLDESIAKLTEVFTPAQLSILAELCRQRKAAGFGAVEIIFQKSHPDTILAKESYKLSQLPSS